MADETRQIDIIMGPYRGHRLTVPAAEADAAINAHWALDPHRKLDEGEEPHDPLTDQQRNDALTAAHTWAQATWDAAQKPPEPPPVDPPPEGGAQSKRAMKPDEGESYKTRQVSESKVPEPKR